MEFEHLKFALVALMEHARGEERRLLEGLTEEQRALAGVPGRWSARDVIAHLAAWKAQAAFTLEAASEGQVLPHVGDIDAFNARVHEEHRSQEWPEITAYADDAHTRLLDRVRAAREAELTDASRFEWRNGMPLWKLVMCDGYEHPVQHLARFHLRSGDTAGAIGVQVRAVDAVSRHLRDPEYVSYALYDLGCLHLKAGGREDALYSLSAAFRLNPDLVRESRDDPELDPIRREISRIS